MGVRGHTLGRSKHLVRRCNRFLVGHHSQVGMGHCVGEWIVEVCGSLLELPLALEALAVMS